MIACEELHLHCRSIMKKIFQLIASALNGKSKDFTKGNLNKAIFLLAVPLVIEMLMEASFALVDVYFVGKVSKEAVATVGLTESIVTLVYALGVGVSAAVAAMVAQRVGAKKMLEASQVGIQSILLTLFMAIVIGIPGFLFAEDILRLMGASDAIVEQGLGYTRIIFASNGVILFLFIINGMLRGAGDAAWSMRVLMISNGLNIILDPLFILGYGPIPAMGVEGAAIATTIGRGVGVVFQFYILFSGRTSIKFSWTQFKPVQAIMLRLLKISSGGVAQYIIGSASWIILMRIVSEFGDAVIAGYTIAVRIIIFCILPCWGISNAAAALVGQNLGADKPKRAESAIIRSAILNVSYLFIVTIILYFNGPAIISVFEQSDQAVLQYGVSALSILSLGYIFFGLGMILSQAFNGAGDTMTPTYVNLFCFWVVEIALAYTLAFTFDWKEQGVFWAVVVSESLLSLIFIYLFRRGNWKSKRA